MAFGKGTVSSEGGSVKKYTGVASVYVLAINPNKEELEKLYGRTLDNAPEYLSEIEEDGKKIPSVRLDFIVKADPTKYLDEDNQPLDFVNKVSIFLRRAYRYNRDKTKVQGIDKYGRTAWATIDEIKNHKVPVYSNGKPANISSDYRPAYVGEEELIKFLIAYLNIPSCTDYINGEYVMKSADKLGDCEAGLDDIENYFKGDVSELKSILSYQPKNKLKVLFGIKNAEDQNGNPRQYQTVYTRMFLRNNVNDYSKLDKEVKQTQNAGSLSNCEFECTDLHEYVVESTDFSNTSATEMPFPPSSEPSPWG